MVRKVSILITTLLFLLISFDSYSYDNEITHRDITTKAVENSNLNRYLIDSLNFISGIETKFNGMPILKWLREGAYLEDSPMCRASNHFHNPLKSWDQSYMSDEPWWIATYCGATGYATKYSSVTWGTGYLSPNGSKITMSNQEWGWDNARNYYYLALTSTTNTNRETYFAKTFQSVGQVLHLIEDGAQPAHVRNDFRSHLAFIGFESINPTRWFGSRFEHYVKNNSALVTSVTPDQILSFTRLTDFWDTDQYKGDNPQVTLSNTIGLSEYTNANYFSDDTIPNNNPTSEHTFPYPQINNADYQICEDYAPGSTDRRRYISRKSKGGCPTPSDVRIADHFATHSIFNEEPEIINNDISMHKLVLDDNVHNTYAKELLPRAVGYSAGLINYFFRGKIDMVEDVSGYRIMNLSDEEMKGNISSFKLFYDDINDNRYEIPLSFFDEYGNQYIDPNTILTIPAQTKSPFTVKLLTMPSAPKRFILIFYGRLGNEDNAVIGRVLSSGNYLVIMAVNHDTRESLPKQFYYLDAISNTLSPVSETQLPFSIIDDSGYWDDVTMTWTKKLHPESLIVPIGSGGPQYIAKYHDTQNNRVRFVLNTSYEKEAYQAFYIPLKDPYTGQKIKDIYYVTFIGSPISAFGMYNENTGWMEYADTGLMTIKAPTPDPYARFFPLYQTTNFNDTFIETPTFKVYNFNGGSYEANIPKDSDAPTPSVVSAYKPQGADYVKVSIPTIFNYIRRGWSSTGSSGLDYYRFYSSTAPAYDYHENKCILEDSNCGYLYDPSSGSSSVNSIFDIPYNHNNYVRVHNNEGGIYYEEVYINGRPVENSAPATDRLRTHYQLLASYKDTAVIRETNFISFNETPLSYSYGAYRIYERQWDFTSRYYIYVKGVRYDLTGITNIKSKLLTTPYSPEIVNGSQVHHLTFEIADDITNYHIDRIFISESFDRSYILVSLDEYTYNNGAGLVNSLKYEPSDSGDGSYILYYGIPPNEIQNADHEGIRTGRKMLLFKSDGTLKTQLQDPIGINFTIGSMGIVD